MKPESVPNELLTAARLEKCWTLAMAAEKANVSIEAYSRWEYGTQAPRLSSLQLLCDAFGKTAEELGFGFLIKKKPLTEEQKYRSGQQEVPSAGFMTLTQAEADLLAPLFPLLKEDGIMTDEAKRETLRTILAIVVGMSSKTPLAALLSSNVEPWERAPLTRFSVDEDTLDQFEKLTTLSWRLLRGNELSTVKALQQRYLPELVALAQYPSQQQKPLATLAAQGHNIAGLLAGQQDDLYGKLVQCNSSIEYSLLAGDRNLEVTALIQQCVAFDYQKQHSKSFQIYKKASAYSHEITPLLAARVYAGLAGSYARCGQQEREAQKYLHLARKVMPAHPEGDPSFLYADCGPFTIPLWEGRIYFELDQYERAFEVFSQVKQQREIPERIRTEFLNHLLETSIAEGDMEKSLSHLNIAVQAALDLGSDRRYRETQESYQQMRAIWRHERKVKEAADLFSFVR